MGSGKSKQKPAAGGHDVDQAYDYKHGPLSKQEIHRRIETEGPAKVSAGEQLRITYAALSQRGFYPDSPHKANQDAFRTELREFGEGNLFFGVFDGHGPVGDLVSGYCRDHVVRNFKNEILSGQGALDDQIEHALHYTNEQLNKCPKIDDRYSGTTSVTAYFRGNKLQIANIGDSRAVLAKRVNGKLVPKAMSNDQTPYRKDERLRVRAAPFYARVCSMDQLDGLEPMHDNFDVALGEEIDVGGDPPRVWHQTRRAPGCAFTRSIGDNVAEGLGVYSTPEITNSELGPDDKFLVLASDGVWEFITSQAVIDMIDEYNDCLEACRHVVAEAYRQWLIYDDRTDDITIIICHLDFAEGVAPVDSMTHEHHHISEMRPVRRGISKDKRKRMESVKKISDELREQVDNFDVESSLVPKSAEEEEKIKNSLSGNFLFQHLNQAQWKTVVGLFRYRNVMKGEKIIQQGDRGDFFYVVDNGKFDVFVNGLPPQDGVSVTADGIKVFEYKARTCFGELALMHDKPRAASVIALEDGGLWCLSFTAFHATCSRASHKELLASLHHVTVLHTLSISQLQRMADIVAEVKFDVGSTILAEGAASDSFYIIKSGGVSCRKAADDDATKSTEVMKLGPLDYLNEKALLERSSVEHTFIAEKPTVLLEISRSRFEEVLGQLDKIISTNSERRRAWNHIHRLKVDESVSGLDSFTKLGQLWSTDTGNVSLVRSNENNQHLFILRTNSKHQVKESNGQKDLMQEKEMMLHLPNHSQFFPELLKCFDDSRALYSLHFVSCATDLASIISLADSSDKLTCGEHEAMYYGVCIALAIKQLQDILVLSRSITPDSILLDNKGFPRLFDFKNAKRLDTELEKTYTMCGSPDYLAPEQVDQQGHGLAADLWALGVLLFEIVSGGSTPFREADSSETAVYSNITEHRLNALKCPDSFSKDFADLLNQMLNPDSQQRMEFSKTWQSHPWWSGIDFQAVRRGGGAAPHMAHCKSKVDEIIAKGETSAATTNFSDDPMTAEADFSCFDGFTLMEHYFQLSANAPTSFSGVVWRKSFVKKKEAKEMKGQT